MNGRGWKLTAVACAVSVAGFAAPDGAAGVRERGDAPLRLTQPPLQQQAGGMEAPPAEPVVTEYEYERPPSQYDDGFYGLIGGGVDIYTGDYADLVDASPAAGVAVGYRKSVLGLEGAYSLGGTEGENNLGDGFDVLRHSGQLAVTVATPTRLQAFVLGGGGAESYNARNGGGGSGISDGTNWYIPAGGGVRYEFGSALTADARFTYNFLFGENWGPANTSGNRMQALLTVGGTL